MSNTTETRTVNEIATEVFVNSEHEHLDLSTDERGNTVLTINNHSIVINDEWNEETNSPEGHTYATYWREDESSDFNEQITVDGSTSNDGLEEFLTDWVNEHA